MVKFWWMFILFAKTASSSDNELPSAEAQKGDQLLKFYLNFLLCPAF